MKVRIKPKSSNGYGMKYALQLKRWWGWKSIGETFSLSSCHDWIKELKTIIDNVEIIKYV